MLVGKLSNHYNIGIIIQARMMSTRLPGKVLSRITGNDLMLDAVINRLRYSQVRNIIVATSDQYEDNQIVSLCKSRKIPCFRGSEDNVLERFYLSAKHHDLDIIVRITSDCPLIDPQTINQMVRKFLNSDCDYLSNVLERTYPRGMDAEVFTFEALEKAYKSAKKPEYLEHVTSYFYTHPKKFKLESYKHPRGLDLSSYRLTVDTKDDLKLIRKIYAKLPKTNNRNTDYYFSLDDIIKILDQHPEWLTINQHIEQKYHSSQEYSSAQSQINSI